MNGNYIRLNVTQGLMEQSEYDFDRPAVCVVGRGKGCFPLVPPEARHILISRRHCLFAIAPPKVWITDLGSLNGTRVNGQRLKNGAVCELTDGDEVCLADTVAFQIESPIPAAVPTKLTRATDIQRGPQCFTVVHKDHSLIVRFKGRRVDLTVDHLNILEDYLINFAQKSSCKRVQLDFGNVENVASITLGHLVRIHQEFAAQGLRISLIGVLPHVYELLEVTNVHELIDIRQERNPVFAAS